MDDDPSVLKALTRLLRTRGFQVRTYGSAEAFLAALPGGLPACLILDLQMPAMSGLELMQQLTRKKTRIPIIVITAHQDTELNERCKSAGASAILRKPLQDTSLFTAIDNASRSSQTPNRAGET
ncbi:MAG TPA: response regulator [Xanthobacteraceae bacterium]